MFGCVLVTAAVVRRGLHKRISDILRHAEVFEVRLKLNLAAPHFEFVYEILKVAAIVRLSLYTEILAIAERRVYLCGISDAQNRDVFALHLRNHREPLHRAHRGRDFAGSPQVLALQRLEKMRRNIVR